MEIYTNIDLKSSIKIEDLEEIPSFVSERDARRLIYVNGKFYYGSTSTWNDVADTATVTASADGLVPTLPNDALKFLNGFGVWEIPLIDESILTQARTPITQTLITILQLEPYYMTQEQRMIGRLHQQSPWQRSLVLFQV